MPQPKVDRVSSNRVRELVHERLVGERVLEPAEGAKRAGERLGLVGLVRDHLLVGEGWEGIEFKLSSPSGNRADGKGGGGGSGKPARRLPGGPGRFPRLAVQPWEFQATIRPLPSRPALSSMTMGVPKFSHAISSARRCWARTGLPTA
ncbi:MAG TPA: hypothetical protein VKY90_08860 [Candidatus Dormibacteraeota bacterium]|nr:hypothetical protein [Candidatus Dormibacteraeota bacterium]